MARLFLFLGLVFDWGPPPAALLLELLRLARSSAELSLEEAWSLASGGKFLRMSIVFELLLFI